MSLADDRLEGKKYSSTEVRTQAKGFKVLCANHYTIELSLEDFAFLLPYIGSSWPTVLNKVS
jgi:hypothetical protein